MALFHLGERAVQARAGVEAVAQRVGQSIKASIPPVAQAFLQAQPFVVVGSMDAHHCVWTSVLTSTPPFMEAVNDHVIRIQAMPIVGDPLADNIGVHATIGLLIIELATRKRMRLNGRVEPSSDGCLYIAAEQVYSNCPKYIQARTLDTVVQVGPPSIQRTDRLTGAQRQRVATTDTFFIASTHPHGGADVSHRGGNPGFVRVQDAHTLAFPDYVGNNMFQTLGNLAVDPTCGLLFIDWAHGTTLQVTGQAVIRWEEDIVAQFAGAQRVVEFMVDTVIEIEQALPFHAASVTYSPFNPV